MSQYTKTSVPPRLRSLCCFSRKLLLLCFATFNMTTRSDGFLKSMLYLELVLSMMAEQVDHAINGLLAAGFIKVS